MKCWVLGLSLLGSLSCKSVNSRSYEKVFGGVNANEDDFPTVVLLIPTGKKLDEYPEKCTGTVIGKDLVVTAAHCLFDGTTGGTDVYKNYVLIASSVAAFHHGYVGPTGIFKAMNDKKGDVDFALLKIEPEKWSGELSKICIGADLPKVGDRITMVGFGLGSRDPCDFADAGVLRTADHTVTSIDKNLGYIKVESSLKGVLPGDSGGPLFSAEKKCTMGVVSGFGREESFFTDLDRPNHRELLKKAGYVFE